MIIAYTNNDEKVVETSNFIDFKGYFMLSLQTE